MKVTKLIPLTIILLFILSGCEETPTEQDQYSKGFEGIKISFMEDRPPSTTHANRDYDIAIEIQNIGAYPHRDEWGHIGGKIHIDGFNQDVITVTPKEKNMKETLYGRSATYPNGVSYMEFFKLQTNGIDSEIHKTKIVANVCYKYKTIASPQICVRKTLDNNAICQAEDITLTGGQGAPIAVTKVKETISEDYLYFDIELENVGGGVVYLREEINSCPNQLNYRNSDKLQIETSILELGRGDCTPETIKLDENKVKLNALGKRKRDHAILNTSKSIIRNLCEGVVQGYTVKMRVVYAHFPVTVKTQDALVLIENFQGERAPRICKIHGNTKVVAKGDVITLTGPVLTDVTQSAAEIEQKTKIKNKDHRVFLDGIYVSSKTKGIEK